MKKYKTIVTITYEVRTKDLWCVPRVDAIVLDISDTFDQAAEVGNKALEELERKFDLVDLGDGLKPAKRRLGTITGHYGLKRSEVTNHMYLDSPFDFVVRIEAISLGKLKSLVSYVLSEQNQTT